ncbi:hypothetical protein R1flu_028585 [Riccia fluitans]|uniref:Uncharacterized protein n=1 Tax=Riccia fluitans TaxID=41844 RepID=A0ABD1XM31_9MARC
MSRKLLNQVRTMKYDVRIAVRASEIHVSYVRNAVEEIFPFADAELSPRRRRWPKLSFAEKNGTGRLLTSMTTSSFDPLSEASAPKSEISREDDSTRVKCVESRKNAVNKSRKVQKNISRASSKRELSTFMDNEKGDLCIARATIENTTEKSSTEVHGGGSPAAADSIETSSGASRIGNYKLIRKSLTRSTLKKNGEISSVYTGNETKGGVFSSKSKPSLERTALNILDRKRREECYQRFILGGCDSKRSNAHDRMLTKAGGSCSEGKAPETNDSRPQKSAKMREMSISGPPDAFREICIDHPNRARCLTYKDEVDSGGQQVEQPATEQRNSSSPVVTEVSERAPSSSDMQGLLTFVTDCSGHLRLPAGYLVTHENSSSTGNYNYNNSHPQKPPEIITSCPKEDELIPDDIPKIWTNPLHQENKAEDLRNTSLSSEKFSSILSYLGHVEESSLQENFRFLPKRDGLEGASGCQSPCTVLEHEDSVSLANSSLTTSLTHISCNQSGDGEVGLNSATSLFEGVRKKMQEFRCRIAAKESESAELLREIERLKAEKEQALSL